MVIIGRTERKVVRIAREEVIVVRKYYGVRKDLFHDLLN